MSKEYKAFDSAFLGKVTRKSEVIGRLEELHLVLKDMPQLEQTERLLGSKRLQRNY